VFTGTAGFLLPHLAPTHPINTVNSGGISDGTYTYRPGRYRHGPHQYRRQECLPADKPFKLTDGKGMYLLVSASGKYWRMDFRSAEKRKTLALRVYPDVTMAEARERRDEARKNGGIPPGRVGGIWAWWTPTPCSVRSNRGSSAGCVQLPEPYQS
jgi:hypothetical protein